MLIPILAPAVLFATFQSNQPGNPVEGYRDANAIIAAAHELATAHGDTMQLDVIGRSRGGRDLVALTLSKGAGHPAFLITGGLDGTCMVSSETAMRVAKLIVETKPELLDHVTFYVIPLANPDALDATLAGPPPQLGALRPVDDDRDAAFDEDPPRDLDGDGVITQIRVKDPKPPYVATLIADEKEPRLLKAPDATKGELAAYAVFTEGLDADGDGRIAEDGRGQVDLNHNFPHRYPEFAPDAGPMQLSEPESLALAKFVVAHRDIVAALTYGRHDTLVKVPETKDMDATGRAPLVYLASDQPMYIEIGKLYREKTEQKRANASDDAGSFWLWLADHRGLLSMASTVWGRPDVPKPEAPKEEKKDEAKPAEPAPAADAPKEAPPETPKHDEEDDDHGHGPFAQQTPPAAPGATPARPTQPQGTPPAAPQGAGQTPQQTPPGGGPPGGGGRRGGRGGGGGGGPGGRGGPGAPPPSDAKPADEDAVEWLAYIDKMRNGVGFIPWHTIDHPMFGTVEVGGFHPLVRLNPPRDEIDALAEKQVAFIVALVERFPKLEVTNPVATKLSDGVWRIEGSVANVGKLPTTTKMGRTARSVDPVVVRISTPIERIVSGQRVRLVDGLDAGERVPLAWIVRTEPGEVITISIGCGPLGTRSFTIRDGAVEEGASHG